MMFLKSMYAVMMKEFLHLRRDTVTLFVTIAIPVFQMIIFGYAIDMEVKNIPTVVYDEDRRYESREFVQSLVNTGYFNIKEYVGSDAAAYDAIVAGRARVAVVIPHDFSAGMTGANSANVKILVDGSDSTVAMQALNVANTIGLQKSLSRVGRIRVEKLPVDVRPRVLFNPDLKSANFFVPGLVGLIMQIVTVFLTAFAIVREREAGTLEMLLVTPVSKGGLMVGKLLPYALLGFFEICIVLLLMRFVFGVQIAGSLPLLLWMCFLFLFTALGLGIFISTAAKNQAQAMQMAVLVMLPSVLLSGFVFPRESMPIPIYMLSFAIPLTYFIEILRGIIIRGADMSSIWEEASVLLGYGLLILAVSAKRFRKNLS